MIAINHQGISWKDALKKQPPLLVPAAHDALAARMIDRAGFTAYIGYATQ